MEKSPKPKKDQEGPLTEEEAEEHRNLYRPKREPWQDLRKILQYALDVIKKPAIVPTWGYIRLFRDIYDAYEEIRWEDLDATKRRLLDQDMQKFNEKISMIGYNQIQLLRQNDICVEKLRLSSARRD